MRHTIIILLTFILISCTKEEIEHTVTGEGTPSQIDCLNPKVTIFDSGFYKANKGQTNKSENVASGYTTTVYGKELISSNVPTKARLNLNFGFRYDIKCSNKIQYIPVTIKVKHPNITNPETGVTSNLSSWSDWAWTFKTNYHTGWEMALPFEIIPGEYTISLIVNGTEHAKKTFHITK